MPSLSQSPILQALGYAIANSLWQMAMVWIVYVLLNSIFKFKSEIKFRIAVAAQVIGFAWFIITLQFYYSQCSQALRVAQALYRENTDQNTVFIASEKGSLLGFFIKAEQVLPYLSVAYLLLLAFLTIRWLKAYKYTQIVRLNGLHKIDVDWKLFVTKVAGQLGIKQKVRIYLSEIINSPVTIGFLKPVILIPIASINHLTSQQLEAVILHELAHIKRHDYMLNIVLSIIELGLFFNPFTRLITKSISKERENSCDDWVLQYQYNPSMYAEALLRIAVMQKTPQMAMYAVKSKSELLSRVQRMVHQKDNRFNYRQQLVALLLMTGILASIAWFDPESIKAQNIQPTEANQVVALEPLAAKISNPLFNGMFFLNEPLKEEVKKNVAATQKQMLKLRRDNEMAIRHIKLPHVMPAVTIENLKDLEKNIASINMSAGETMKNIPLVYHIAQPGFFHIDTTQFKGNMAFTADGNQWKNMAANLMNSQKGIADAFKKGLISKAEARKMEAEIQKAFKELEAVQIQMPQQFFFVPGMEAETAFIYRERQSDDRLQEQKERRRAIDEKRKVDNEEKVQSHKLKRILADSLRKKFFTLANARNLFSRQVMEGFAANTDALPFGVAAELAEEGGKQLPPVARIQIPNLPQLYNAGNNTYAYSQNETEAACAETGAKERTHRIIVNKPVVAGKIKTVILKNRNAASSANNSNCTAADNGKTANNTASEKVVVEIEIE